MDNEYETLIEPVVSRRTFEEVSERLKKLIFDGTFKPGQQLPSEATLAQLFQVGRQSVREALRILEISGFISIKPGGKGGAVIAGTLVSNLSDLFLQTFKFDRVSLEDCVSTRRMIEMSTMEWVLNNADQHDIQNLRKNVERAEAKLAIGVVAFEENKEFHKLLAKATKNNVVLIIMELLLAVYADFRVKAGSFDLLQSRDMVNCHKALIEAIVKKRKKQAFSLMEQDLTLGGEVLMNHREESGSMDPQPGK